MQDLVADIRALLITKPMAEKPLEENFSSRMAYLRAKTKWHSQYGGSTPKAPATDEQIQILKDRFFDPIPELVIDLFRIANGDVCFRPEYQLYSIESALELNRTYSEFDEFDTITEEPVYPAKTLQRFLPLFGIDKVDVGIFIMPSQSTAVYAIDIWDTKVCYLAKSLESYLSFMLQANRDALYKARTTSDPLQYSKREKILAEKYEAPGSIYPLAKKKGKTYFSIYSGDHWPKELVDF